MGPTPLERAGQNHIAGQQGEIGESKAYDLRRFEDELFGV